MRRPGRSPSRSLFLILSAVVAGTLVLSGPALAAGGHHQAASHRRATRPSRPAARPVAKRPAKPAAKPAARVAPQPAPTVAARPAPRVAARQKWGPGYLLASADGGIFSFGNARYYGGMAGRSLAGAVVGLAGAPDGRGYWEVSSDGGVFAFGSAHYFGGMAGNGIEQPVVGMAAMPDGSGYWLVGADGGVFTYGAAHYYGGLGSRRLRAAVTGIAATPDGGGYWLVSSDGGVFAFGDARYLGGMGGHPISAPVVGMAVTPDGSGYWLVSSDGGVFTYGTAPYFGGMGGLDLAAPMVGLAATPTGHGYWMASADGGVFTYGDAGYWGAPGGFGINRPLTAVAAGMHPAFHPRQVQVGGRYGFDVSWPQCGQGGLPPAHAFAVVGVTGGKAFTANPCLGRQWQWGTQAAGAAAVYMNLNEADDPTSPNSARGPAGHCAPDGAPCAAYNYGANAVDFAVNYARRSGVSAPMWWLDVETGNSWSDHADLNAEVIRGALDELNHRRLSAGIYSTALQWSEITGGATFGVPVWVAGSPDLSSAAGYCGRGFAGGPVWMVQTMLDYDVNYLCQPARAAEAFGVHPLPTAPAWPADRLPDSIRIPS